MSAHEALSAEDAALVAEAFALLPDDVATLVHKGYILDQMTPVLAQIRADGYAEHATLSHEALEAARADERRRAGEREAALREALDTAREQRDDLRELLDGEREQHGKALAEAWDEGYVSCYDDKHYEPGYGAGNPFRAALAADEPEAAEGGAER